MTPLQSKQLAMRIRHTRLSVQDQIAITDRWPKTCLALLTLQKTEMRRELERSEVKEMVRLKKLVGVRFKVYGEPAESCRRII